MSMKWIYLGLLCSNTLLENTSLLHVKQNIKFWEHLVNIITSNLLFWWLFHCCKLLGWCEPQFFFSMISNRKQFCMHQTMSSLAPNHIHFVVAKWTLIFGSRFLWCECLWWWLWLNILPFHNKTRLDWLGDWLLHTYSCTSERSD